MVRPRATKVAAGQRPTKENRLQRSPCSTDSSRKPGPSPTIARKAPTGVRLSATSSRQTGTTEWRRARSRNDARSGHPGGAPSSPAPLTGRSAERAVKAGPIAGVARPATFLVDRDQQCVGVAVVCRRLHPLAVPGGLALAPVLLAAAAPEPAPAGSQGTAQRLGVHVAEHQDLTCPAVLHDRGNEPLFVETDPGDVLVGEVNRHTVHRYSPVPSSRRSEATAGMSRSRRIT